MKNEYGIIGYPLGQSLSKPFFNNKFSKEGIDAEYLTFEIPTIEELPQQIAAHPNLRGFNVTIPYKLEIKKYLKCISSEAAAIDAVNVVKIIRDKNGEATLFGYNSDVIGFTHSLTPLLTHNHRKALILGTGGVSKAVAYSLKKLGIEYIFASRTSNDNKISYQELTPSIIEQCTLIVNCTPLGMAGHGEELYPQIPYQLLTPQHLLYDVIYNPEETMFLKKGKEAGAAIKNGYEMWYLQALASWEIWNS